MWQRILFCWLAMVLVHLCTGLGTAYAQTPKKIAPPVPPKPDRIAPPHPITPPPQLISTPAGEQPIVLKRLHLTTEIAGGLAQTTVEMEFLNPNNRNLEGNLQFPLQDQQQIIAFALDIDGKLRSAVPVEKARGQQIFEEVQRKQIDPGLLEMTQGNNFKLRIFPIPAHGTRTVQLRYTEALARQDKNWALRLPIGFGEAWQEIELDVIARDVAQAPQTSGGLQTLAFSKQGQDFRAHSVFKNNGGKGELRLLLAAKLEPKIAIQKVGDETYFVAEVAANSSASPRPLPKRVAVLWDASSSGTKRDLDAEMNELGTYLKALGNAEVKLTLLRDTVEEAGMFTVSSGNWDTLRQALKKIVYDGASALNAWRVDASIEEYLLFSDGLQNYGNAAFPQLSEKQRLYAINSAASSDSVRLAAWAEANGGKLVQVNPSKPGSAAQAVLQEGLHIDHIAGNGVKEVLFAHREAQNGLIRLAGKVVAQEASVQLQLSQNGKASTINIKFPALAQAGQHPFAGFLWAQFKLRQLEADLELHRAEIRRIGQQFAIPTLETSLLVLDRLEDYLRYEVTPPAELQAAFAQMQQVYQQGKLQKRQSHLEKVLQLFQAKQAWWEKDFPKDKPAQKADVDLKSGRVHPAGSVRMAESAAAPAPMMMAPPPPPAPAMAGAAPRAAMKAKKSSSASGNSGSDEERAPEIGITLKKWISNAPYIARMKAAKPEQVYAIYLDEKPSFANSSAFYLDVADLLIEGGKRDLGLRVLSNLAEMDLENRGLLRILAYRLLQEKQARLAIPIFEKVLLLAPEEPQSLRDLALALAQDLQNQRAVNLLNQVVEGEWDQRFPEIETIALAEMNAIIATSTVKIDTSAIDPRLVKNMPLDLRVIMTWDADNSDMDLWVTDPNGEKCIYNHPLTYQGGRMSRDFTQGYGPEEFSLRFAKPGKYRIETNFYGNRQQVLAGATTLSVKLTTGFGTAKQKEQIITLRLREAKETVFVGEFEVKP